MHNTTKRFPGNWASTMSRALVTGVCVLAALTLPAVVAASTDRTVETWTNEPTDLFYNSGGFCTGQTVAGYGIESGRAITTITPNDGFHVTGYAQGTYTLYEASGPPWDVTFGAFVGTWSYSISFDEQIAPGGNGSFGNTSGGRLVYADGSSQYFRIVFRFVPQPDGPPRLFLVKFVCGAVTGA
jgi:hypothetical protein